MASLVRTLLVVVLLATPVVVVVELPRLFEIAGSVPVTASDVGFATPAPAFSLLPTPTPFAPRFSPLDDTPPPTLSPPVATAAPAPTRPPTPTGERIVIGNTGGLGAVLRAEPVTGPPVAALRDSQVVDVIEHRAIPGSGDWVHVRTADGKEGWVTGRVAIPAPANRP